ncbi:MAG: hypothetical protein HYX60_10570 [Legionella longbeachae]|nr:hypothetical protein [Legionella longbeachae]
MHNVKIGDIKHSIFGKQPITHLLFKEYAFNLNQLESELSTLYKLFISNKHKLKKNSDLAYYLRYLIETMIYYYQCDPVHDKLNELIKKREAIDTFFGEMISHDKKEKKEKTFSSFLFDGMKNTTLDYLSSLTTLAKTKEHISTLNANRIYWIYCRNLAIHAINHIKDSNIPDFIKQVNNHIGYQFNPDTFIQVLNKPKQVLYLLSVGIYALRFMINLITMTKHIILASLNEKLSTQSIVENEIEKRGFQMLNDCTFGTVNLLTNYNQLFNISSKSALQINVVFAYFAIALLVAQWSVEAVKHERRVSELKGQLTSGDPILSDLERKVIERQVDILEDEWEVQCSYYLFNITAASLMAMSLGATIIFTGPFALTGLALVSMISTALFNTANQYKSYQQKCIAVRREQKNELIPEDTHHQQLLKELNEESSQAHSLFWKTLVYNIAGPSFIITAAAISWPISLGLTLTYLAYQVNCNYKKQQDDEKKEDRDLYRLFDNKPDNQPKEIQLDEQQKIEKSF